MDKSKQYKNFSKFLKNRYNKSYYVIYSYNLTIINNIKKINP